MTGHIINRRASDDEAPRERAAGPLDLVVSGLKDGLYQGIHAAIRDIDGATKEPSEMP